MAAPPPPNAQSGGGDAPLSLFLDTDLGTRIALLVARDTTISHLKSQVAAEHAAAFPDIGSVAVKSFQIRRKGALYQLSESMTVTRSLPRVKAEYFLHVKMAEAAGAVRCCQGTPEIDGRRTSEGDAGINVEKHHRKLPAATPKVANDGLAHGHGGAVLNNAHVHDVVPNILPTPSSQLDTETKNEAKGLANDVDAAKSLKQTNISHVMETDAKEDLLHSNRDYATDRDVSDNKQIRIEDTLGQGHSADDVYLRKDRKKAKRTDSVYTAATDPSITNESNIIDRNKSARTLLETNPTHGQRSNTSFTQEVNDIIPECSLQKETTGTDGKKRKRHALAPPKGVSGQETIKLQSGAVGLSESGADASEVDLTNRDGSKAGSSVFLVTSEPCNESQGGKHVESVNNAQACTYMTSGQGNSDHVHDGDCNPSIENAINSTAEAAASGGKITERNSGPWDGGEKHQETKQHKYNEDSHDDDRDVAAISNMEKDGKNIDALEEKPTNNNTKKRKKGKKVSTVDMASMDTAGEKQILGHTEHVGKTDKVCAKREILCVPSVGPTLNNLQQRDSNVTETPTDGGKPNKRKRRKSESLKKDDPNQDHTRSSEQVRDGCSIHNKNSAPQDAKQTTQVSVEGLTVSDNKFAESLDIAAENTIAEALVDLKSRDSISKELRENLLKEQSHLDSNMSALILAASTGNKVSNNAELPPKYNEAIPSDASARSHIHKKHKGKQLNRLSATETKSKESDSLRFSDKTSDLKDVFTGDIAEQDDDKNKSTKRQRKKVPTGKTIQYLDEQINKVAREDMEAVDAFIQADLVQGGSVNDTALETVAKVKQKGKRTSKNEPPKIQEAIHSTHTAKDSQDENAFGITLTHDDEHASGYPKELPVVHKDSATLESSSLNAQKEQKKYLKTELRSWDSAMEQDPSAEKNSVNPKNSADAFEANHCIESHPASDKVNFVGKFSMGKMNDQLVSSENIQNKEDEIMEAKNTKSDSRTTEPKELQKSTSQEKAPVSNLVKSFAMNPATSSDSTVGTPQLTHRFRKNPIFRAMNMLKRNPTKK